METARRTSGESTSMPNSLRPLGLGEILDLAITLYRRNFLTLVGISAIVALPLLVLQIIATVFAIPLDPFSFGRTSAPSSIFSDPVSLALFYGAFGVIGILNGVASVFQVGATNTAVSETYLGRAATIKQSYGNAFRHWLPLLIANFLVGLATLIVLAPFFAMIGLSIFMSFIGASSQTSSALGLGILCLCALSIPLFLFLMYLTINWAFISQSVVLENTTALGALRRSRQLVKGSFWRVLLMLFLLGIFVYIITAVPTFTVQFASMTLLGFSSLIPALLNSVITTVISTLIEPLQFTILTVFYYDLRIRKEGFDLQFSMQQLDSTAPAPTGSV